MVLKVKYIIPIGKTLVEVNIFKRQISRLSKTGIRTIVCSGQGQVFKSQIRPLRTGCTSTLVAIIATTDFNNSSVAAGSLEDECFIGNVYVANVKRPLPVQNNFTIRDISTSSDKLILVRNSHNRCTPTQAPCAAHDQECAQQLL